MYCLNRVQLIGYQTQPLEVRQTPGGTSVVDLNIIVPMMLKGDDGREIASKSFHVVTLWGALADVAGQFLRPGAHVFIGGRLQTDSWEDASTGEKKSKTKVIGGEMILLEPKGGALPAPANAPSLTSCLNRAELIGNVTKDPEIRTTTSGQQVLSLGVATNESWKDKASGERKERTEFHNVVFWGPKATEVAQAVRKGSKIYVAGRVQTRSFETQAGVKKYTTEVIADTALLLGIQNAVAQESLRSDVPTRPSSPAQSKKPDEPAQTFGSDPSPSLDAGIPDIDYQPEIKVSDLPF